METKRTERWTTAASAAERMADYTRCDLPEAKKSLEKMALSSDDKEAWGRWFMEAERNITSAMVRLTIVREKMSDMKEESE